MLGSRLKLVGRQTPTQTGWLDLLAVDQDDGCLVVFELKRGTLAREAVTQVVDYASALDAMSADELAAHISERSGADGIEAIEDFKQWYADTIGGDDLSRLLPPRMVLVGLGVDPVAERMARFISGGPVNLSVVTFHGFLDGKEKVLARQLDVEPGPRGQPVRRRSVSADVQRKALREYLTANGYAELFDRVHDDIRQLLPERGVWPQPGSKGIGFQLPDPDSPQKYRTYFGVQAGYANAVCSVSILPEAIRWDSSALQRLESSIELRDWPHGGHYCAFQSEEEWSKQKTAVLEFVRTAMSNRLHALETGIRN